MKIEARVNPVWAGKWTFCGLVLLGVAGWCYYDGAVVYPRHNARLEAYDKTQRDPARWARLAAERGWPADPPRGKPYSDGAIFSQWVMLGLCAAGGVGALGLVARHAGRRLIADDEALHTLDGRRIGYGQITGLDKSRWRDRGIAWVKYTDAAGHEGRARLDDYVFRGAAAVLEQIELQTGLGDRVVD